jgi:hypothetical protein
MSQIEKTSVTVGEPDISVPPRPARSAAVEIDVPPMIQKAIEKHRSDLAELLRGHKYHWAAYCGDTRLEIGESKRSLYLKYLDRGMSLDELVVLGIGPQIPDEIDGDDSSDA